MLFSINGAEFVQIFYRTFFSEKYRNILAFSVYVE